MVRPRHRLAHHVDERRIGEAIRTAEARTSGRILLLLSHKTGANIVDAAKHAFAKLRMHDTKHRNSTLFYVVPENREFAVYGDAALHEKLGQGFWDRLASEMGQKIREANLTAGVIYGVEQVGRELAVHFPKD